MSTAQIGSNALSYLSKYEPVSTEAIDKACIALKRTPNDILEILNNIDEEIINK